MREFRILGHWVGDVAGDDPVGVALAVVVSARAIGRGYEGFDVDLEEHQSERRRDRASGSLTIVGNVLVVPLDVVIVSGVV